LHEYTEAGQVKPGFFNTPLMQTVLFYVILPPFENPCNLGLGFMINYDLHIHTEYCGHAENMNIEAILKNADAAGLDTICIADHIYSPADISVPDKIRNEVALYNSDCRVLVGAEIDIAGRYSDGRMVSDLPDGLDYVIGGVHYIPGPGNYPRSAADNPLEPKELLARWKTTMLGVCENPQIDTVAHPGRLIATSLDMNDHFDDMLEIFKELVPVAAENKKLWEINEHDKNKIPVEFYDEWYKIYEIALDAGVRLIYGSDSHFPEGIGGNEFVQKVLEKLPADCLETPRSIGLL
jgi:HisJ family histidinol phosphate phosphatase